jgi:membrane-bound serine protease (ClpP class)
MAPGTNLGAATPVNLGLPEAAPKKPSGKDEAAKPADTPSEESAMSRKQVHDAAAYIRSLAQLRGRNADWAERAVREAVSLPADDAVRQKVVDMTASDVHDLLAKLDGREVTTASGKHTLATRDAPLVTVEPDWRTRFLGVVTDPSVALLLLMAGIYLLIFEFMSPGIALPGVLGAICLLTGLFALQMLPVNYAGLALVLLGIVFMVAEVFYPTYGSLGIGGVVAFAFGAVMLIDTDVPGFGVSPALIGALAVVSALFMLFVVGMAVKARKRPVVTGDEELIGSVGVALEDVESEGWATVHSEQWRVRSAVPLRRGQHVRITARDGLVLAVEPTGEARGG